MIPFLGGADAPSRAELVDGPMPPDNSNRSLSLISGVFYDRTPWSLNFGDTKQDVQKTHYKRGETAKATFVGANPRNNLRLEKTFAALERRKGPEEDWQLARDDSDWGLIFHWRRTSSVLGTSEVEVVWEIEDWALPGEYRLRYFGDSKTLWGAVSAFDGASSVFRIA